MSLKHTLYRIFSPIINKMSPSKILTAPAQAITPSSFYGLHAIQNNGRPFPFEQLKGKKVLIVNTASACGYTPQYEGLEQLYKDYNNELVVLGFPSNQFGEQEQGTDAAIAEFCQVNYGVSFPIMQKSLVRKGAEQNDVFNWLTHPEKNGWNSQEPEWNFNKYLIDENGNLLRYFSSGVGPLENEITGLLGK